MDLNCWDVFCGNGDGRKVDFFFVVEILSVVIDDSEIFLVIESVGMDLCGGSAMMLGFWGPMCNRCDDFFRNHLFGDS